MKSINNIRFFLFGSILLFSIISLQAQVGIGTNAPEGMLDISSTTNGLIYPRVALTKLNNPLPVVNPNGGPLVAGTIVYNTSYTTSGENDVYPGIYAWDGSVWVGQYIKEQTEKFVQNPADLRTKESDSYVDVSGLGSSTFTAKYTGKYKIKVNFNFSAGKLDAAEISEQVGMATEEGYFKFRFNGVDHLVYTHSYSIYNKNIGGGTHYEGFKHESSLVLYEDLTAGTTYNFSLQMDQLTAGVSFIGSGNSGDGRGHVGLEVPCNVIITFLYE